MKKYYNKLILVGVAAVSMFSCTGDFDKMNTHPTQPTETSPDLLFPKMQQYAYNARSWEYQVGENLHVNQYAQYVACTATYFSTDRYATNDSWVRDGFWRSYYYYVAQQMRNTEEMLDKKPEYMNMYQIMRIFSAFVAQRTTDVFGDVPYFEAGTGKKDAKFDSQKEIYADLFKELDDAIEYLEQNKDKNLAKFGAKDLIYNGDYDKWIKLANSLRLRMAIRIAYVDAATAKIEGEKALAYGKFIDGRSEDAGVTNFIKENANSFWTISFWNEFRASKTIIDGMLAQGTINKSNVNDPRLPYLFSKTQGYLANVSGVPEYRGVPNGLAADQFTKEEYMPQHNSCIWGYQCCDWNAKKPGDTKLNDQPQEKVYALIERPVPVMLTSEVYFLKAEAALRGWANAGDIEDNYKKGIEESLEEVRYNAVYKEFDNSDDDEEYINDNKLVNKNDFEKTLEQIASQKWLALFPNGVEAWSEVRRTGYPALNPVAVNESSDIPQGQFIKKMLIINDEMRLNPNAKDPGRNTRVWWNTNTRYK